MIAVRDAGPEDGAFLLRALGWAANWRGTETDDSVPADPAISRYLDGWPREGDFGVIAEGGAGPVGAAWCRIFSAGEPGFGYVAPEIPELTIAVAPSNRGQGVGRALLAAVVDRARSGAFRRSASASRTETMRCDSTKESGFAPPAAVEARSR